MFIKHMVTYFWPYSTCSHTIVFHSLKMILEIQVIQLCMDFLVDPLTRGQTSVVYMRHYMIPIQAPCERKQQNVRDVPPYIKNFLL